MLLLVLAIALIYDLMFHRIPNWLTATGLITGIVLHSYFQGVAGLLTSLGGAAIGLTLFLPFYIKRAMGAGDVKFMAAVSACMGLPLSLHAVCASLIMGSIFGFLYYAVFGGFRDFLPRFTQMAKTLTATGQFIYLAPAPGDAGKRKFPYSTAICSGTLIVMVQTDQLGADTLLRLPQLAGGLFG